MNFNFIKLNTEKKKHNKFYFILDILLLFFILISIYFIVFPIKVFSENLSNTNKSNNSSNSNSDTTNANESNMPSNCNVSFEIFSDKDIYSNGEKVQFSHLVESNDDWQIEYWIEDSYGGIVKSKRNTTTKTLKSFTTSEETFREALFLKAKLYSCIDIEKTKVVGILNNLSNDENGNNSNGDNQDGDTNSEEKISNSSIVVLDNSTKIDNIISIHTKISRYNTRKYALNAYLEYNGKKITENTKLWMKNEGEYEILIPFIIDSCYNSVNVIVEGLDYLENKSVVLDGECKIQSTSQDDINKVISNNLINYLISQNKSIIDYLPIKSLYTKHTNPKKEINLYANIDTQGEYLFEVDTLNERINLTKFIENKETLKFPIKLKPGKNIIGFRVSQDNKTIQEKNFVVNSSLSLDEYYSDTELFTNLNNEGDNNQNSNNNNNNNNGNADYINNDLNSYSDSHSQFNSNYNNGNSTYYYSTRTNKILKTKHIILISILTFLIGLIIYNKGVNYLKAE